MQKKKGGARAADSRIPPGWGYNPSRWSERIPIVLLALAGTGVAGYLSLFQFELIETVWEPFFGAGTRNVLDSGLSHVLPVPDAALGAFGYLVDAVTGAIGGRERWRTMPWIVILFGLAVGPLGVISIALVMSQPLVVGSWCTLCLASAVISLLMIGPAMDEMLASLQYMKREWTQGRSFRHVFWGVKTPRDAPASAARGEAANTGMPGSAPWPWPYLAAAGLGLWLMAAPGVLDYAGVAEMSDRITGPLVVTFSFIAIWEITRPLLRIDLLAGIWLAAAPWLFGFPEAAKWSSVITGIVLAGLSFVKIPRKERFGGGWSSLWPLRRAEDRG